MAITNIFDAKVVDHEGKMDRAPLVAPEARGGGGFVVAMFLKACAKDTIGDFTRLGKDVDAFADIKIDTTITDVFSEVLFINKKMSKVGYFESDILWEVDRSLKNNIVDAEAGNFGVRARQDTVEHDIDELKRGSICANSTGLVYTVAINGDPCAVGIRFWGADKTDNLGVGYFFAAVNEDIFIIDEMKSVSALDCLSRTVRSFTNYFTETPEVVGI